MTAIGYARLRPVDDAAAVRAELTTAGCTTVFLDEQVSIRADWPQLQDALAAVSAGGTLIVCRLIHIGRSLEHLVDLLVNFDHRGVRLRALHEQIDTAEHGELLRQITHGLIEARQVWRSEATKDGLAAAVAAGRKPGRRPSPPVLSAEQEELARHLEAAGHPVTEIADLLGVSRAAMYRTRRPDQAPTTGKDSTP